MGRFLNGLLIIFTAVICIWYYMQYSYRKDPLYADALGYYMYLPSTFIYHNHKSIDQLPPDNTIPPNIRADIDGLENCMGRTPKGYILNKYTYGVAAMELPFFLAAHAYEKITGKEANGYSDSYRNAVKISAIFYCLMGLLCIYLTLRYFFSSTLSLMGTIIILPGTNLFWFTLYQAGMAHVPLFFLYALLIYLTVLLHRSPQTKYFIFAGLTAGMITLIRPVDAICILIPLLYNVYSRASLLEKMRFLRLHVREIVLSMVMFVIPLIPQSLYWKMLAGKFIYYSYGREKFNWLHPKIIEGLIGFSNGWLPYTPLMILALLGMFLYKNIRPLSLILFTVTPVYIYIIYSWDCYNYVNGLGSRPMIHLYPLLSLPLTALLGYIAEKGFVWKSLTFCVIAFFIAVNISYSVQQPKGILFSEESNATYNLHMLFKTQATYRDLVMYDIAEVQPEPATLQKTATLAYRNYEDSISENYVPDPTHKSKYVYCIKDEEEYPQSSIMIKYDPVLFKNAEWIKCSGNFLCPKTPGYYKHMYTVKMIHNYNTIYWKGCKIDNKIGLTDSGISPDQYTLSHLIINQWGYIYFYVKIPPGLQAGDIINVDVWNVAKQEMFFDNLCVELYKRK